MERTIFGFILAYSKREQIILMLVTLASFPFLYYSLDLPKIIINDAINGGVHLRSFLGWSFSQLEYLFLLCGIFLVLVLFNGGFKYFINVYRGRLAELMLRRIRYILFSRVLRFPLPHFSKLSQGEIVSIITAEAEPLGGFFGEAFSLPLYQGGMLVTILGFIAIQDPYMGMAAIALYPLQMWLIPKLQSHVNQLAKKRVLNIRKVSDHISETVGGVYEIHANDTAQYELAGISDLLGRNFSIRLKIYKRKFFIKFLNNFIAQITPFFFYSIGGYLVIQGDLSFGALVASLAAYKDLATPWKELLSWYQRKEDTRIKYDQLVERFHPDGMMDESIQYGEPETPLEIAANPITTANLGWQDEGGIKAVDGVSLHITPGDKVLIVGGGGSGKEHLARMLARVLAPTSGSIRLGDENLALLPESITGRRIAYSSSESFMFSGTISENLLYGLKHRPMIPANYDPEFKVIRQNQLKIAKQAGNSGHDHQADWIDYPSVGLEGPDQLIERIVHTLHIVGLYEDVYTMGLQRRISPEDNPELCAAILKVRESLAETLNQANASHLVEHFDETRYNENASVAENLLFGTTVGDGLTPTKLAENPYVMETLEKSGLLTVFTDMGLQAATVMLDLFSDLPPGHEFFERYGFINSDDLPNFRSLLGRIERDGINKISRQDHCSLIALPFNLVVARHRLGIIDQGRQEMILTARKMFRENLPRNLEGSIEFFDAAKYNATATIQDNILFGRLYYSQKEAEQTIGKLIREAVDEMDLYKDLMVAGLELSAGIGGKRLAPAQRQKISLARSLFKQPDILVMDEILSALEKDEKKQIISRVIAEIGDATLILIDADESLSEYFSRVMFMKHGRLTETDTEPAQIEEEAPENLAEEVRLLRKIPMMASFDTSTLKLLAFTSKRLTFEAGEMICHQGEKGDTAYIIIDGLAEILVDSEGAETIINEVNPNEIVGEIALLSDIPRIASVRAVKKVTALELSKQQFFSLIEQDQMVVMEMLRQMSARLEHTTAMLLEKNS